jgi:hypothetical protein
MVMLHSSRLHREGGALMTELMVAMALLVIAVVPIGYSISSERVLARSYYQRAVATEIVDGEIEVLLAGDWHNFSPGTHNYSIQANAATNLPPGKFLLTIESGKVRLEWRPDEKHHGGPVVREAVVK